jgi:hypothetical protein
MFKDKLKELGACQKAVEWVGDRTMKEAFRDCPRGDWILWAHEKFFPERKRERVLAAAHCANTVRHLMKNDRSKKAVDTAIAYGEGKVTEKELRTAAYGSYAVVENADYAVAAAAFSFSTAAYGEDAYDVAYAVAHAAADDKEENQKKTADICRKYLTTKEEKYE